jgi:hypothetical protein
MLNNRPQYEPVAWWYTRKKIGRALSERLQPPEELSPRLGALLAELGEKPVTSVEDNSARDPATQTEP